MYTEHKNKFGKTWNIQKLSCIEKEKCEEKENLLTYSNSQLN